jgi:hypothetical protein
MGVCDLATLKRFTGRQLALVFARRCRAQGATDWNIRPPPSVVVSGPSLPPMLGPFPFALNLAGPPTTYLKEGPAMKSAFLIIAVAVAMFGVAAISMAHHTHSKTYAYWRR